jgi:hypothetical protein
VLTGAGASIDTTRPEGKLHFAMLAAFEEFERKLNRERIKAWIAAAKRGGRNVERPRKLTDHKLNHARQLIGDGKENRAGAAALFSVHVKTLRRAVKGNTRTFWLFGGSRSSKAASLPLPQRGQQDSPARRSTPEPRGISPSRWALRGSVLN